MRRARVAGAVKRGPGRQIVSQDSPSGVSRFGGWAGTQAPDPTPVHRQNRGSRAGAGSTTHILPADYERLRYVTALLVRFEVLLVRSDDYPPADPQQPSDELALPHLQRARVRRRARHLRDHRGAAHRALAALAAGLRSPLPALLFPPTLTSLFTPPS